MRDAVTKLIERYDFVLIDCEYDLKYLNLLTDCMIDVAIIVTTPTKDSIELSSKIYDGSRKYAPNGQMGIILNKYNKDSEYIDMINSLELDLLGYLSNNSNLNNISNELENIYIRLNLPQE